MRRTALGSFGATGSWLAIAVILLAAAGPVGTAQAAMTDVSGQVITTGGVSPVGEAEFQVIGGGGTGSDPYKLSGGGTFVSDGTEGTMIFRTTGDIQFILNEDWNVAWDFTTDYQSGDATWQIDWESNCPIFGSIEFETPEIPIPDGQEHYDGDFSFTNRFFWTSKQPFVADIVIEWDGAAGETFTVTIPDNSIDFSVGEIPEPDDVSGDTNNDGVVDAADYMTVKGNLGQAAGAGATDGDFDEDGRVGWDDLQALATGMADAGGAGGSPTSPEPAALSLLAAGGLILLRRRRVAGT